MTNRPLEDQHDDDIAINMGKELFELQQRLQAKTNLINDIDERLAHACDEIRSVRDALLKL